MIMNVPLVRKQSELMADICAIEKVVELPENEFLAFRGSPMKEQDFLRDFNSEDHEHHLDLGVRPCVMVLGENHDDGICVYTAGYDYARYSAYVPNARQIIEAKMELQSDPAISM